MSAISDDRAAATTEPERIRQDPDVVRTSEQTSRTVYVPPDIDSDEPLDEIEQALVRALVDLWAPEILAELDAEAKEQARRATGETNG